MAQPQAFNQALIRCGFNGDTAVAIAAEGFDTLDILTSMAPDDVDAMIKNVRETRRALGAAAQGNVTFPFLATRRLKAMQNWGQELLRTGRPLNPGGFVGNEITNAVSRLALETLRQEVHEDEDVDKPRELTDLTKWEIFWERFVSYLSRLRGAAKCPYTYIIREHDAVTPDHYAAVYQDHDAKLVATTQLQGDWYTLDNHRVYDEFKNLVVKGPGWSFVKAFDKTKDGRNAVLTLKRQCEGTSAIQTRKAAAYARIASARYNGQKRGFTFDTYVELHQTAYNTLSELNEAVPETKKVTDFLAGIGDPRLTNAKDFILADPTKLQDFEACQQFLKTLIYNKTTQEKHERHISAISGGNKPNSKPAKRGGGKRARMDINNKNLVRSYSREEWMKLSDEQRAEIKALRDAKKAAASAEPRHASSTVSSVTYDTSLDNGQVVQQIAQPSTVPAAAIAATTVTSPRVHFVPATKPPTQP
mmetsp:Transcript_687/g.1003  ORF Transcript_687/g.1003 Transcript_687/m.1003 type:complete len:475 (+) Transcript_687:126-1550(+)